MIIFPRDDANTITKPFRHATTGYVFADVFLVFDELSQTFLGTLKYRPKMTPAEIMLVAVVAARYFNNNLERALIILGETHYIPQSRWLSVSRFNRPLHQYADCLDFYLPTLMELARTGDAFVIDRMPVPVCRRARARRCRTVRGRAYGGYGDAKKEKFFGWRLHLICTPAGQPVVFQLLPGSFHDLTPIYEITVDLPADAALYGDKGYNYADGEEILALDGLRLIPIRKKNMVPHSWADEHDLHLYRKSIETVNSQLESMGVEHLRARTNAGLQIKVCTSLIALRHTQIRYCYVVGCPGRSPVSTGRVDAFTQPCLSALCLRMNYARLSDTIKKANDYRMFVLLKSTTISAIIFS